MKPSASILAVLGLRTEILSPSLKEVPAEANIDLHSDSLGNGGRADRGVSFGLEVEVEYEEEREAVCRIRSGRVDETDVGLKPGREAYFSDTLETREVENIVLLDLHVLKVWQTERS